MKPAPTPDWVKWMDDCNSNHLSLAYAELREAQAKLTKAKEEMNNLTLNPIEDAKKIIALQKAHQELEAVKKKIEQEQVGQA